MHSAQQSETSKNGKSAGLSPNGSSNTKQDQRHKRTSSNLTSTSNQNVNYTPRISIFGVVRRLREQRYFMVQSVSQYEFIYEYMLDYLASMGLIKLKWPRDAFGISEEQTDGASNRDPAPGE